ncbi:Protein of unknown function (DUF581) [Quillaja saponaria]|uniref:FLZ-type domain-containing protein n=1 Tax=Quillaja saponaria TaxID=32244 RepID=A0AAD7LEU7_QUISA|nr:Protein of unknown function (DUF581) [Quillaja saponaria]
MLLGKRPRPPIMRRTTSMTGITVDVQQMTDNNVEQQEPSDIHPTTTARDAQATKKVVGAEDQAMFDQQLLALVSPRIVNNKNLRRNSADFIETPPFLLTCGLCKRRLAPGRDIYMYRGDTAFCSLECREKQMKQDERKEKSKVATKRDDGRHASPPTTATSCSMWASSAKSQLSS